MSGLDEESEDEDEFADEESAAAAFARRAKQNGSREWMYTPPLTPLKAFFTMLHDLDRFSITPKFFAAPAKRHRIFVTAKAPGKEQVFFEEMLPKLWDVNADLDSSALKKLLYTDFHKNYLLPQAYEPGRTPAAAKPREIWGDFVKQTGYDVLGAAQDAKLAKQIADATSPQAWDAIAPRLWGGVRHELNVGTGAVKISTGIDSTAIYEAVIETVADGCVATFSQLLGDSTPAMGLWHKPENLHYFKFWFDASRAKAAAFKRVKNASFKNNETDRDRAVSLNMYEFGLADTTYAWEREGLCVYNNLVKLKLGWKDGLSPSQLLAILLFTRTNAVADRDSVLNRHLRNKGRFQEALTGEGKTVIVVGTAFLAVARGKFVDAMTSNKQLALEGLEYAEKLLGATDIGFGISMGHNFDFDFLNNGTSNNNSPTNAKADKNGHYTSGTKPCYTKMIVYGEYSNYMFDKLRDEWLMLETMGNNLSGKGRHAPRLGTGGKNITGPEGLDLANEDVIAIVDEVDSVLLDKATGINKIASALPGKQLLGQLYFTIAQIVEQVLKTVENINGVEYMLNGKLEKIGEEPLPGSAKIDDAKTEDAKPVDSEGKPVPLQSVFYFWHNEQLAMGYGGGSSSSSGRSSEEDYADSFEKPLKVTESSLDSLVAQHAKIPPLDGRVIGERLTRRDAESIQAEAEKALNDYYLEEAVAKFEGEETEENGPLSLKQASRVLQNLKTQRILAKAKNKLTTDSEDLIAAHVLHRVEKMILWPRERHEVLGDLLQIVDPNSSSGGGGGGFMRIPTHMWNSIRKAMPLWVQNAILAFQRFKEEEHYSLEESSPETPWKRKVGRFLLMFP